MNTNLIHNVLNVLITVVSALMAFDWSAFAAFGLTPQAVATVIAALGGLKLVINALRDGLAGLVAVQPPVEKP